MVNKKMNNLANVINSWRNLLRPCHRARMSLDWRPIFRIVIFTFTWTIKGLKNVKIYILWVL